MCTNFQIDLCVCATRAFVYKNTIKTLFIASKEEMCCVSVYGPALIGVCLATKELARQIKRVIDLRFLFDDCQSSKLQVFRQ